MDILWLGLDCNKSTSVDKSYSTIPDLIDEYSLEAFEIQSDIYGDVELVPDQFVLGPKEIALKIGDFFARYEQILVWSIAPTNAPMILYLSALYGRDYVKIICSDDEIERRYIYYSHMQSNQQLESFLREKLLFSTLVEAAFEAVNCFIVPNEPWEKILKINRKNPITILPYVTPMSVDLLTENIDALKKNKGIYKLFVFPKPSLDWNISLKTILDCANYWAINDTVLEMITIRQEKEFQREDGEPCSFIISGSNVKLTIYHYPLSENSYYRTLASCNGLVIVPRGGITAIRHAIRYGLDIFNPPIEWSPNTIILRNEMGTHVMDLAPVKVLHDGFASDLQTRNANKLSLGKIIKKREVQEHPSQAGHHAG